MPSPRGSGFTSMVIVALCSLPGDHPVVLLRVGDRGADRLPVGNLGLSHPGFDLELAEDAGHQDVEMQLPHSRNDELPCLHVLLYGEGRVFQGQNVQDLLQLFPLREGLRLDGHRDDGNREMHLFQQDRECLHAKGVPGLGTLQPDHDRDVPGLHVVELLGMVGVHPQQTVHPLPFLLCDVEDGLAFLDPAGVHPHVAEVARFPAWPGA